MIYCGTDIIEINRIKKLIENNNNFIKKIYTENEIKYCESKNKQKYQHYAARFSAKEAIFKAISKLLENKYEIEWKDVEILNDENSRPYINFIKKFDFLNKIENIDISISHCKDYATSTIIINVK